MVALSLVEDEVLSNIAASEYCLPGICLEREGIRIVKPPNTANLGTGKKTAVFRKQWYWESYYNLIWDLEMGGGIGRGGIGGDDCTTIIRGAI